MFTFRTLVGALSALASVQAVTRYPVPRTMTHRAVIDGDVCATVDLVLLGINFASGVCICLEAGLITRASATTLNQQITANSGILSGAINTLGGVTGAAANLVENLTPFLLQQPTSCRYPANAVPNACGSCGYECYSDDQVTYVRCGDQCILQGAPCQSPAPIGGGGGGTGRRRDTAASSLLHICPGNKQACPVPVGAKSPTRARLNPKFECINTASDLESCGGCAHPLVGQKRGQDCTAIPNIASVSCEAGQCVVDECEEGYVVDGATCIEGPKQDGALYTIGRKIGSGVLSHLIA